MPSLSNKYFEWSPLTAELSVEREVDEEGWRHFHLRLTVDAEQTREVAACREQLNVADLDRLIGGLRELVRLSSTNLSFAPTEPSFMLRAGVVSRDEIEVLWIVDQGALEKQYTTETGVGLLMSVTPKQLEGFADELEERVTG